MQKINQKILLALSALVLFLWVEFLRVLFWFGLFVSFSFSLLVLFREVFFMISALVAAEDQATFSRASYRY